MAAAGRSRRRTPNSGPTRPFVVVEQVVGPLHRVAQRLVAFQPAPASRQQPEPVTETVAHLLRAHRHHPRRRQLDRQRDPVQPPADLRHRVRVVGLVQREARSDRPGRVRRTTPPPPTRPRRATSSDGTGHSCSAPTRSPSRDVAITFTVAVRGQDRLDQVGRRVEHVLAVVQHDQQPPPRQGLGDAVGHRQPGLGGDAQDGGHRVGHGGRIADRGQLDQPHPVGELGRSARRRPARPGGSCRPRPRRSGSPADGRAPARPAPSPRPRDPRSSSPAPAGSPAPRPPSATAGTRPADPSARTWNRCSPPDRSRSRCSPRSTRSTPIQRARRRRRHQDLAAVTGRHHPGRPVQHRPEVVVPAPRPHRWRCPCAPATPTAAAPRPRRRPRREPTRTPRTPRHRCA